MSSVILAHAGRDGWMGAVELAEGAEGQGRHEEFAWTDEAAILCAARNRFARRVSVNSGR
ncbi:MAG TPA: hypothetical protein VFU88_17445 [Ktedonobacterales bacterium]|nr:hypothetical protein [Ktedonobacterales bacterium]